MSSLEKNVIQYVESNIGSFHQKRIDRLATLKLSEVLKRKNPYLFKAKYIITAHDLIKSIIDAHLSSQEETIFGDWLEGLAIFINQCVYQGRKSAAKGIDLEFEKDNKWYIISIKSGPHWGNSSQIKKMEIDFNTAKKTLGTSGNKKEIVAVNGCCYGKENQPHKGSYLKYCGQDFWAFISGDPELYVKLIEPLGFQAKERNDMFMLQYGALINKFTVEFASQFCFDDGSIDWQKLLRFNAGKN